MVSRYDNREIGENSTEQYYELLKDRGLKKINQYFSPSMRYPSGEEVSQLQTARHEWKLGDRYFKLADKYYGDSKLWWIVAWFNQMPTDAHVKIGDIVEVPLQIGLTLKIMGF